MSASMTALDTFLDGAIKTFLENPSVESAQLIVGMANTIRENTAPPCSGGCCSEVHHGGGMEAEPALPVWHQHGIAEGETDGEEMYDSHEEPDDGEGESMWCDDGGPPVKVGLKTGHVMGEGILPSGIGCAWIPSEGERNTENSQCECVRSGKIQLVVAKTEHELNESHYSGEWCPCPGEQKKWIYRHFSSFNVSNFEQHAPKEVMDMWQLVRSKADDNGWVCYGTIREYFSLQNYHSYHSQCQAFYKLHDDWKILMPINIPKNSTSLFQLKPQFR